MPRRSHFPLVALLLAGLCWTSPAQCQPAGEPAATLPGEFERQAAVVLAWDNEEQGLEDVLLAVVRAIQGRLRVIILVNDDAARAHVARMLGDANVDSDAIQIVMLSFESVWTRDYGPFEMVANGRNAVFVDPEHPRTDRIHDNLAPSELAQRLQMPSVRIPLVVEGGNLLSNGGGLIVATEALLEKNELAGHNQDFVEKSLRRDLGARQIVILERLIGEESGHVDMFVTFVARDTVVVGAYDPHDDPINSAVLDRNADRLSRLIGPAGKLKVVRIPMGRRDFDIWRTYTNVFYANGVLLLPTYPKLDPDGDVVARRVYHRVLPDWRIVGIDCSRLIEWGGGLHCVTANLPHLPATREPTQPQP